MRTTVCAVTALLVIAIGGCERGGCVARKAQVPLLRKPYPTNMPFDPPLPPNDTLRMLQPGQYHYVAENVEKQWTTLRIRYGGVEGYVVRDADIAQPCPAQ